MEAINKTNILKNLPMRFVCIALLITSSLVMTGWIIKNIVLVQIHPRFVPMQFNTALCFFLSGSAILISNLKWNRLAQALSAYVLIFVSITLSEYIFGTNIGIDQLFVSPFTTINTIHPGRMAPNTALAFLISSIILLLANTKLQSSYYKLELMTLLSLIVSAIGIFALFGYVSGIKTAYGWGRFTFMAVHTASGFLLLGLGLLFSCLKANLKKNRWLVLSPGIGTLLITLLLWQLFNLFENKQMAKSIQTESKTLADILEIEIKSQLLAINRMAKRIESGEEKSQEFWMKDAKNYIKDANYYKAIIFLNEKNKIQWIEPDNNRKIQQLIDLEIKNLPTVKQAFIAPPIEIDSEALLLLIAPVSEGEGDTGSILAIIEFKKLFDQYLNAENISKNFKVEIFNGEQKFYESKGFGNPFSEQMGYTYAEQKIDIANQSWLINLYPSISFLNSSSSSSPEIILIFGTLLSLCVSLAMLLAQKSKENELSADLFRQLINGVRDYAIYWLDLEGNIQSWNPGVMHLKGYSSEELMGKNFSIFFTEEDRVRGVPKESLEIAHRNGKFEAEGIRVRKDGSRFEAWVTLEALHDSDGKVIGFAKITRDISEWKKVDKMKSEFISTVSHELRTPLTSIRGALGILQAGITGELPEKSKPLVKIALNNCERLVRLINDILDIEKIESGKMEFQFKSILLNPIIQQTVESNHAFAADFGVSLNFIPSDTKLWVKADSDRLMQVLTNLISNAVKFSPQGESVTITSRSVGDKVRIEIIDRGPGIAEEFLDKIFKKFMQADSSDSRQKGGTGLGLSISKNIIELSGGKIGFENNPDRGTCFYFELPQIEALS